ncbi:hypothetical protein GGI20_000065 [Coemansia sp. BCRC 34301]|nr:hypothetical protein GGI20_000065 [Coemansia sp. BCRC 34301]
MAVPSSVDVPESMVLEPGEWRYKGEGNENMVFSYRGGNVDIRGWLLRLSKCDAAKNASVSTTCRLDDLQRKQANAAYVTGVIGPLLGPEYILQQRLVKLEPAFLCQLQAACEPLRPAHRIYRQIDQQQSVGTLMPNAFRGIPVGGASQRAQVVTVELKPKWGFMPSPASLSSHSSAKARVCRYCMHQFTKHAAQDISCFCPLDLFSGDRHRIVRALDCLAQSPQNNLRVFVDDHLAIDSRGKVSEECVPRWEALRDCIADIVLKERLFPRLKECQRRLDSLDIEGIFPLYTRAVKSGSLANVQPSTSDWLSAVANYLQHTEKAGPAATEVDDKQAVLEFLISTTLKDISVLITLPEWAVSNASLDGTCTEPRYAIAVIDSDPKRLTKIPEYHAKDQRIVATYLKHCPELDSQRPCRE